MLLKRVTPPGAIAPAFRALSAATRDGTQVDQTGLRHLLSPADTAPRRAGYLDELALNRQNAAGTGNGQVDFCMVRPRRQQHRKERQAFSCLKQRRSSPKVDWIQTAREYQYWLNPEGHYEVRSHLDRSRKKVNCPKMALITSDCG